MFADGKRVRLHWEEPVRGREDPVPANALMLSYELELVDGLANVLNHGVAVYEIELAVAERQVAGIR